MLVPSALLYSASEQSTEPLNSSFYWQKMQIVLSNFTLVDAWLFV